MTPSDYRTGRKRTSSWSALRRRVRMQLGIVVALAALVMSGLLSLSVSPARAADPSGDADFAASSGSTTRQVDQGTLDIVYSGPSSGMVGDALALAATVTDALSSDPVAGLPLGLSFQGLGCGGTTDASGVATCNVFLRLAGTTDATATFAGSDQYAAATGSGAVTISKAWTATTARVDVTEAYVTEPVTITAHVSYPDGGTVSFNDGGVPLAGCDAVPLVAGSGSAVPWTAICTTTALAPAYHTLEAIYSGTANYYRSAGSTTLIVNPAPTTLTYTGESTGIVGGSLAVSAVLTSTVGADPVPVAGQTVEFSTSELTCTGITDASGVATCNVFLQLAGTTDATATFAGSDLYSAATGRGSVTISKAWTGTTTTVEVTEAYVTEPVAITASVSPTGSGTVDGGTVSFNDGGVPLAGCDALPLVAGNGSAVPWTATCTTTALTPGNHTLEAIYSGTDNYFRSAGSASLLVNPAPTALSYTGEGTEIVGGSLTVSAVLTSTAGADPLPLAGQTIEFGMSGLTCTAITGDDGSAACELPITAAAQGGELTVTFAGVRDYASSSTTAEITIDPADSTLSYLGDTEAEVGTPLDVSAQLAVTQQPAAASAGDRLRGPGAFLLAATAVPDPIGLRILFTLGTAQCAALTDADGVASCSLTPAASADPAELIISFAGTADLFAAALSVPIAVAAAPVPSDPPASDPPSSDPPASDPPSSDPPSTDAPTSADPATPAPPSAGGLATTGLTIGGWLAAGLAVLGLGALMLLADRHRAACRLR